MNGYFDTAVHLAIQHLDGLPAGPNKTAAAVIVMRAVVSCQEDRFNGYFDDLAATKRVINAYGLAILDFRGVNSIAAVEALFREVSQLIDEEVSKRDVQGGEDGD